jgi:GT2 family glycosyltransferase
VSPDARTTVVVMTRDRRAELLRTLDLMTRLPERLPITVVDNASSDGTADAVAETYPEVRLIRASRNLGAVARNLAVEHVTGTRGWRR